MDDVTNGQGGGRKRLLNDLTLVIRDAEQLMRGGRQAGENDEATLASLVSSLSAARESLVEVEQKLMAGAREAVDTTDRYVRQNPWQSVAVGALAGVMLGVLLRRR